MKKNLVLVLFAFFFSSINAQVQMSTDFTDDANKIPIRMKASLAVGSLRADLEAYKGLVNSFMNK